MSNDGMLDGVRSPTLSTRVCGENAESTYCFGGTELVQLHVVHVTVLPDKVRLERFNKLDGNVERDRDNILEDDQTRAVMVVEKR